MTGRRIALRILRMLWIPVFCCLLAAEDEDWTAVARSAQAQGDYLRAARAYSKLIEAGGESAELRSNYGLMLYLAGQNAEALVQSRLAVKLNPDLVGGNLVAGLSLLGLNRPKEAIPYLKKASQKDPLRPAPALALAKAYMALQDILQANRAFEDAAKRDPNNAESWYGLGVTYRSLSEEAFRQNAQGTVQNRKRGEELLEKAYAALDHAGKLDPASIHAALIIAESLREAGSLDTAVAQYQIAIRQNPNHLGGYLGLATTYWRHGRIDEAFPPLKRALELAPRDPDANEMMADILSRRGEHRKAMACAYLALAGNPSLVEARIVLAKAYMENSRPQLAAEQLQKALPLDKDGTYHYLLYQAYTQLGQTEKAARALETFKKLREAARNPR